VSSTVMAGMAINSSSEGESNFADASTISND